MTELRTRIGAGGRVVLPAAIRRAIGAAIGDELLVFADDEGVHLVTPAQAARRARRLVAKWVPAGRSLAKELIAERRTEAAHE